MYNYTTCGLDNVWLKNGFKIHTTGYGDGVAIHNLDGLHKAIAKSVVSGSAELTGKEFRFLRVELDLSINSLAAILGEASADIKEWEAGSVAPHSNAAMALRKLYIESTGEGVASELVSSVAALDRQIHELSIEMEEHDGYWEALQAA
jgi:DNA-binding transcriptional regulator YiaG